MIFKTIFNVLKDNRKYMKLFAVKSSKLEKDYSKIYLKTFINHKFFLRQLFLSTIANGP